MDTDEESLLQVNDVGPVVSGSIIRFFKEPHNRQIIAGLAQAGVHAVPEAVPTGAGQRLAGQPQVLAGTMPNWTGEPAQGPALCPGGTVNRTGRQKTSPIGGGRGGGS